MLSLLLTSGNVSKVYSNKTPCDAITNNDSVIFALFCLVREKANIFIRLILKLIVCLVSSKKKFQYDFLSFFVRSLHSAKEALERFLVPYIVHTYIQKYSRLRCLLRVKGLVICFYLGWSGSILHFRQSIIKVGSKSWLLTCSSNITLSLLTFIHCFCFVERAKIL